MLSSPPGREVACLAPLASGGQGCPVPTTITTRAHSGGFRYGGRRGGVLALPGDRGPGLSAPLGEAEAAPGAGGGAQGGVGLAGSGACGAGGCLEG